MTEAIAFEDGGVRGFLHRPQSADGPGLVLTHGAGGDCRMPLLVAAAEAFVEAGVTVLRCDLPFRQRRPKGPPSPSGAAADRAGLREAAAAMRRAVAGPVFLGGQSYGGRQATMLAAEEPGRRGCAAAVFVSAAPAGETGAAAHRAFSPPRRAGPLRIGHGRPVRRAERSAVAVGLIPAPTRIIVMDGAGHDLRRGRFDLAAVAAALLEIARRRELPSVARTPTI